MVRRILNLVKHAREAKTALSTLSYLYDGENDALDALGGLTEEEISGLVAWLPERGTFAEFGTLFGLTAKAVAAARPNLRIVAIDNFSWNPFGLPPDLHEALTRKILANEIGSGQIELCRTTSEDFRKSALHPTTGARRPSLDAVFFDALHQYEPVKDEIEWAKTAGIPIVSGHDYGNPNPIFGVTRAVDEVFGKKNVEVVGMCWRARTDA